MPGSRTQHAGWRLWLPMLIAACSPAFDDHAGELPPAVACDPTATLDPGAPEGLTFDASEMLCLGVEMDRGDFDAMRHESRMGGDSEIEITGNVFAQLIHDCTTPHPDHFNWYQANLTLAGDALSNVGIRKKGFLGSVIGTGFAKPSLLIKTDKLVSGQSFVGSDRITLNNGAQDKSRIATCLAYAVFTAAGHPAPRCNLANVMVNQRATGAYAHVEAIDKAFLRRAFGNEDGSLYEGAVADVTPGFLGEASRGNLGHFEAKTDATDATGAPLLRLMHALESSDDTLLASLEPVLDVPRFITFWAIELLIAHEDGYASNRNNFYVYFDPAADGRAVFIPWGVDDVFNDDRMFDAGLTSGAPFARGEIARRLSRLPEGRAMFEAELARLLNDVWNEGELEALIDLHADQIKSAEADPGYDARLDTLRGWVRGRRAHLDASTPHGDAGPVRCNDFPISQFLLDLFQKIGFAG